MKKKKKFEKNLITLNQSLYINYFFDFLNYNCNNFFNINYYYCFFNYFNYCIKINNFFFFYLSNYAYFNGFLKRSFFFLFFDFFKNFDYKYKFVNSENIYFDRFDNFSLFYFRNKRKFINFNYTDEIDYDFNALNLEKNIFFLNDYKKFQMYNNDLSNLFVSFYIMQELSQYLFFIKAFNYYKIILYFIFLSIK
jgi:hypothetical protein